MFAYLVGMKRFMLLGLSIITISSFAAGLAVNYEMLLRPASWRAWAPRCTPPPP